MKLTATIHAFTDHQLMTSLLTFQRTIPTLVRVHSTHTRTCMHTYTQKHTCTHTFINKDVKSKYWNVKDQNR